MSLIDKQLKASKLQKELALKRDELAYKSLNHLTEPDRQLEIFEKEL